MRVKLVLLILFALISNISMISAEIMLSQPKSIYSINDILEISATIKANENIDGFLTLSLKCGLDKNDFYLSPLSLQAGQQEKIDKKLALSKSFLKELGGDCKIEARYGNDFATTTGFQITNRVETILNVNPLNVKPNEKISVKGTAIKANSQPLEGFVEISIIETDIELVRTVSQGKFETNLTLPENLKSGNYQMIVKVYDKSGEENGNQDLKSVSISLRQEPTKIEIVIDKQSIKPGEGIKIRPIIYDQANENVDGDLKIEIKDIIDDVYFTRLVKSGEDMEISLQENASAGYWKIEASSLGLKAKRLFYVEELEKASFEILNDTLIITNIGNVPYRKAIQIVIGNEVEIKEMDLDIGESKKFRLLAPDGNYKVSVTDGTETLTLNEIGLTGNVIGVEDIRKQLSIWNKYPIVWLFLIIVFGLFVLMMIERVVKKNFYGFPVERASEKEKSKKEIKTIKSGNLEGFEIAKDIREAEHSLVINGRKEEASILALRIRNPEIMKNKIIKDSIEKAVEKITSSKGSLYRTGENLIGVFTPSLTKTFKNDLIAVKVAGAIASHLNEQNKRFTQKIDFGIGISSGDIAVKIDKNKLKFTSLGNTLNLARRIADNSKNDVLLSQQANNKVMNEVKTEKSGDFYSIKRIVDREQHKDFINSFLKRQ